MNKYFKNNIKVKINNNKNILFILITVKFNVFNQYVFLFQIYIYF